MSLPDISAYLARLRFRFCPLCATPLEPQQHASRVRLVCPRDGWVHYPQTNLAATVVIEHAEGIVLLRRAIPPDVGIWHLPIGHLEFGEPPDVAALREASEETGLDLDEPVFLDFEYTPSPGDPAMFYVVFGYRARAVGGSLRINAENSEAQIVAPDALPELHWSAQRRAVYGHWAAYRSCATYIVKYLFHRLFTRSLLLRNGPRARRRWTKHLGFT